jgi:hypothetical protein
MPKLNPAITHACAICLRLMVDNDYEMAVDGLEVWVGSHRTNRAVFNRLMEECLITKSAYGDIYWQAKTSECQRVLSDPNYETMWREHRRTGKPVHR